MEHATRDEVTIFANEIDNLFADGRAAAEPVKPKRFNYDKLHAVLCMAASALVCVSAIAWLFFS